MVVYLHIFQLILVLSMLSNFYAVVLSMVEQAAKPLARPVRVSSLSTRYAKGV